MVLFRLPCISIGNPSFQKRQRQHNFATHVSSTIGCGFMYLYFSCIVLFMYRPFPHGLYCTFSPETITYSFLFLLIVAVCHLYLFPNGSYNNRFCFFTNHPTVQPNLKKKNLGFVCSFITFFAHLDTCFSVGVRRSFILLVVLNTHKNGQGRRFPKKSRYKFRFTCFVSKQ